MRDAQAPRRHRRAFWSAVVLAVAVIATGTIVAVTGYLRTGGPDGVVGRYYAALARGDAPGALALGLPPDAPHTLLTSTVLREQRRIAPIRDVTVGSVDQHGSQASVAVRYTLGFAGAPRSVRDVVAVRLVDGTWRLQHAAATTQLQVVRGADRSTILGGPVPDGVVGLFPGAVPITFDTAYLELDPAHSDVTFGGDPTTQVFPRVSPAGTRAVRAAVAVGLHRCFTGRGDLRCPLPYGRAVPGSVRGQILGNVSTGLSVDLNDGATGRLRATGDVKVRGSYRVLSFRNVVATSTGTFTLSVLASTYAHAPLVISWDPPL